MKHDIKQAAMRVEPHKQKCVLRQLTDSTYRIASHRTESYRIVRGLIQTLTAAKTWESFDHELNSHQ